MKTYQFTRTQRLPITMAKAWEFFSNPANLARITPSGMNFRIIGDTGSKMFEGQIIRYKVTVFPFYTVRWVSEITKVIEPFHFIDEQLLGPYAYWRHQHYFRAISDGIEMIDKVSYAVPFGWLGRLANAIFVQRELNSIFDYRYTVLEKYFKKEKQEINLSARP